MATMDIDLRLFKRYFKKIPFTVRVKDKAYRAATIDYSVTGLCSLIYGSPPLKSGDVVPLDIDELGIHQKGRVIRIERTDSGLRVGVLKLGNLKGSLRDYRLSDIFIGFQRTLKTGIFAVTRGSAVRKIYLDRGDIIFATSMADEDRLGDVLLREGWLSKEQYSHAAQQKQGTGERYAAILIRMGYLRPYHLKKAVRLQAQKILESLFSSGDASFDFTEGSLPPQEVIPLNLSAAELIYREVKRSVSPEALVEGCPLESVIDFSPNPLNLFQHIQLGKDDRKIVAYVDGKTSVLDILRLSPVNEEETLRCLYALLEARILVIKQEGDSPVGISYEEILEMQEDRLSHLIVEGINNTYEKCENLGYYGILGLNKAASPEEIKRAYHQTAKQYHPDLHFSLSEDVKEKLNYIFSYVNNAYAVLKDDRKREEYDKSLVQRSAGVRPGADIALAKFTEGMACFKGRQFEDAERLFAEATYYATTNSKYHYYHGLALSELGRLKEAVKALETSLKGDPRNPDIYAELGHVFLKLDLRLRAQRNFERSISLAPSNKRAAEGLKLLK